MRPKMGRPAPMSRRPGRWSFAEDVLGVYHRPHHPRRLRPQGVANLFMGFEPLAGWRQATMTTHRLAVDFAHFIKAEHGGA